MGGGGGQSLQPLTQSDSPFPMSLCACSQPLDSSLISDPSHQPPSCAPAPPNP